MDSFTISQMQQFSGIKAHTIRVWEQRYQALTPNRSEGNTRYYDNSQLRRLLNIVSLIEGEDKHAASKVCKLSDEELGNRIAEKLAAEEDNFNGVEHYISQLVAASVNFDEAYFDKVFSNSLLRLGLKKTYIHVLYPLLNRIGMMWASGTMPPAQEHFLSHLIKQKLYAAIDALPPASLKKSTWILFLPEDEFHEIGLLFANYVLREAGHRVIYLGANVPKSTLLKTVQKCAATRLLCFFVSKQEESIAQKWINWMEENMEKAHLHISGNPKLIEKLKRGKNTIWLKTVSDLERQAV